MGASEFVVGGWPTCPGSESAAISSRESRRAMYRFHHSQALNACFGPQTDSRGPIMLAISLNKELSKGPNLIIFIQQRNLGLTVAPPPCRAVARGSLVWPCTNYRAGEIWWKSTAIRYGQ